MAEPADTNNITQRTLVVTVGTSLRRSASWRPEGPFAVVDRYDRWVSPDEWLEEPASRHGHGHQTVPEVQAILERESPERLAGYFAKDFAHPLRYSGELTTLVRLYEREAGEVRLAPDAGLAEYLTQRYRPIQLVCPRSEKDPAHLCARHLEGILHHALGHPDVHLVAALRSHQVGERLGQLRGYLQYLGREQRLRGVDLLVTGGYKAYAMLAGRFVASQPQATGWRLVYLHEDAPSQLVVEGRDAGDDCWMEVAGETVVEERWPPPDLEDAR